MSTQQDIYAAGFESRPPMLNKENYVPWSSCLLRYAKSRPNGKLVHNSILNGPYVRKMIPEPGDANRDITEIWLRVQQMMKGSDIRIQEKKAKLFNEWERFTSNERESIESYYHHFLKLMNDLKRNKHFPKKIASNLNQKEVIQNAVQNPRVQNVGNQNGLIGVQGNGNQNQIRNGNMVAVRAERNAAGQNENQIRCYNCRGVGHYARNCIVRPRRKDAAYLQTQLLIAQKEEAGIQLQAEEYDLMAAAADLDEIKEVNANCISMANLQEASTSGTHTDSALVYDTDGSAENYLHQPIPNPEDITDPTTAMNMALVLMAKAFKLNYSTPTNNNQRISSNTRNMQIAQPGMNMGQDRQMQMVRGNGRNQFRQYTGQNAGNTNGYNDVIGNQNQIGNGNLVVVRADGNAAGKNGNQIRCYNCRGVDHYARNCIVRPRRMDAAYLQTQLLIAQKEEAGIQLQAEEYDLMAAVADLEQIKEVNANFILMANLQQASTSGTQTDSAPVYDTDGSAEEATKFVGDFKSLANEADASLAKHKALELEIERLLKAVVRIVLNLPKSAKNQTISTQDQKSEEKPDQKAVLSE
nr:hypothetical protein [Tanacetum cinerariifolium]